MWSLVDQALCVMDVSIIPCASGTEGLRRVLEVKEDKARKTAAVARLGTVHIEEVVLLRPLDDVVHTSQRKLVPVPSQVSVGAESHGTFLVIDIK